MSPGSGNWEANVNPTVADQRKAVATVTADDVAHAAHEVYEALLSAGPRKPEVSATGNRD